jgi:U3 small nucleolar RNA-associated protein 20
VGEASQSRIVGILNGWIRDRAQNKVLAGAALNVLGSLIGSQVDVSDSATRAMLPIIAESARQLGNAEAEAEQSAFPTQLDHIVPHQALSGLGKLLTLDNFALEAEQELPLDDIIAHLLFPHDWVRFDTTRVLSTLFSKDGGAGVAEFTDQQLLDVARKACIVLKGGKDMDGEETVVDPKLADEVVKLLWNIAKYWAVRLSALSRSSGELSPNRWNAADMQAKEAAGELTASADAPDEVDGGADADADADMDVEAGADTTTTKSTITRKPKSHNPLSWLMSRASFLARTLIVNRPASHIPYLATQWTRPVMSILRFFAGSIQAMDEGLASRYAKHVLNPVYRVLDEGGELGAVKEGDEGLGKSFLILVEVSASIGHRRRDTLLGRNASTTTKPAHACFMASLSVPEPS